MKFMLYHSQMGYFETDNLLQVDRKLAQGYKFSDDPTLEKPPLETVNERVPRKRGRPRKIKKE